MSERAVAVPYELVMVEWDDSTVPVSSWQWVDDYEMPDVVRCVSVGFLIAKTKAAIALAPNMGDLTCSRHQASAIIRIPRKAVLSIRSLSASSSAISGARCAAPPSRQAPAPASA